MATKHILSALIILVVLTSSIYLVFDDKVKINIQKTRTQYYVMEDSNWILSATEYVYLYDGTTKMRAKSRNVSYFNDSESYSVVRKSLWKDNITTIQTYKFYNDIEEIKDFPSENTFECINCEGKFIQFEIRDIDYSGETKNIVSPFSFGHNMKISWKQNDDFSWAKVYQNKVASDKIIVKFKADNSYEEYFVRLYDPPVYGATELQDSLGESLTDGGQNFLGLGSGVNSWFVGHRFNSTGNYTIREIQIYKSTDNSFSGEVFVGLYPTFENGTINVTQIGSNSSHYDISGTGYQNITIDTNDMIVESSKSYLLVWARNTSGSGFIRLGETLDTGGFIWTGADVLGGGKIGDLGGVSTYLNNVITLNIKIFGGTELTSGVTAEQDQPIDGLNTSDNTVLLGCNFTSFIETNISNVTVNVFDSSNNLDYANTDTTPGGLTKSVNKTWITSVLTDDIYNWSCSSNGDDNTFSDTTNRTFTLDATIPLVSISFPLAQNYNVNISELNFSTSDSNIDTCLFSDDELSTSTNISCVSNLTGLTSVQGDNNWTIWVNDTFGHSNFSSVFFIVDTASPIINITYPINNSFFENVLIGINYTFEDTNPDNCFWTNDSGTTNHTITCGENITSTIWGVGQNDVTITIVDIFNREDSDTITFFIEDINWSINNQTNNFTLELGTQVNINISNLGGSSSSVCIDIDHPNYGNEYICGDPSITFPFNISYFRNNLFNDSSIIKNISWVDGGNQTIYITGHQYDEVIGLKLNVTAYESNGTTPTNLKVYLNNTLVQEFGIILESSGDSLLFTLNDSSTFKNYTFNSIPDSETDYLKLFKTATIINASFNLTGFLYPVNYSEFVYDEIDDSSINQDLWENHSLLNCPNAFTTCLITENSENISIRISGDSSTNVITEASFRSTGFSPLETINNITARITISCIKSASLKTSAIVTIFGNVVESFLLNDCTSVVGGDASNWTLNKNETLGINRFDVFDDGVFQEQIIATNNVLDFEISQVRTTGAGGGGDFVQIDIGYVYHNSNLFPTDPNLEVGASDGIREWEVSGGFKESNITDDFGIVLQNYLDSDSCVADLQGFCDVPFFLSSQTFGRIFLQDINVTFTSDLGQIIFDESLVSSFLGNSTNFANIPIKFETSSNGTLEISDIGYDYAGGNSTIDFLVFSNSSGKDRSVNSSFNIINYYSDWFFKLPRHVNFLEFIPTTSNSKNVTPFGQTPTKPFFNITTTNYGGKNMNLSAYLNETFSCVNLTISTTQNKTDGIVLGPNWAYLNISLEYQTNVKWWMWADYNCTSTSWSWWFPDMYFRGCAEGVACSEDII